MLFSFLLTILYNHLRFYNWQGHTTHTKHLLWRMHRTLISMGFCMKAFMLWQNPDFYKIDILNLLLFYRTFSCESPPNPLKRWADRIVLRSRDITGDYWVETNWWPWWGRGRCESQCSKTHFLNILANSVLFLHVGWCRKRALHTSWSSKVSVGGNRSCADIWLQIL